MSQFFVRVFFSCLFETIGDIQHKCVNSGCPYLELKHFHSADAHPAFQRVRVRDVEVKHDTQAQDGDQLGLKHAPAHRCASPACN